MQDVTYPEDLPGNLALFERMATTDEGFVIEKRYVRPDGSSVWVQNSVSRVTNPDGSPRGGGVAVSQDITARKEAEAALAESERRWRTLAETLPALVWVARPDGVVDYYSQRWSECTGLTVAQLISQGWQAALHPDDLARGTARWEEVRRAGQPYEHEARWRRAADATYHWHLIRRTQWRAPNGQGSGRKINLGENLSRWAQKAAERYCFSSVRVSLVFRRAMRNSRRSSRSDW